jgi:sugar/nucleoside kinase (ribokinase family)
VRDATELRVVRLGIVGMATLDLLYVTKSHPQEDSENAALEHLPVVGGPAGRSAIAAARLGGDIRLLAMIGADMFADALTRQLAAEAVKAAWISEPVASQHSCVLVSEATGLRTTIWLPQPRANREILDRLGHVADQADTLLLDCTDEALTKAAVAAARRRQRPVVIDPGSYKPWAEDVLHGLDHVIVPEKFLRRRFPEVPDVAEAARMAYGVYRPAVLGVTQGKDGGLWADADGIHRYSPYPVEAVDTCGAGDTFHGAYAWAVSAGLAPRAAFRTAAWSAGQKCAALGNGTIPGRADWLAACAAGAFGPERALRGADNDPARPGA